MKVIEKSFEIGSFRETGLLSKQMIHDLKEIIQKNLNNSSWNINVEIDDRCILTVSTQRYMSEIYSIINYNSPVTWGMTTSYEGRNCISEKFWLYKAYIVFRMKNGNIITYSYNLNKKRFLLSQIESNSYSSKSSCILVSSNIEKMEYRKG